MQETAYVMDNSQQTEQTQKRKPEPETAVQVYKKSKFTFSIPSVARQVKWKVENFKKLALKQFLHSHSEYFELKFEFENTLINMPSKWSMCLELLTNGDSIGIYLKIDKACTSKPATIPVKYQFVINSDIAGKSKLYGPYETDFKHNIFGRYPTPVFSHASLMAPLSEYLPNGTLTVELTIEMFGAKSINTEVMGPRNTEKLQSTSRLAAFDDISKLLETGLNSDLVIRTKDLKVFHVHRNILAARSPVFKAMFAADMVEQSTGRVEIDDIGSKAVDLLLKFLYSGVLDGSWTEVAEEMVYAADKYDLPLLKKFCDKRLIGAVTQNSAIDFLLIAKRHSLLTATADILLFIKDKVGLVLESLLEERSSPKDK